MKIKNIGKLFFKNLILTEIALVILFIIMGAFVFHNLEGRKVLDSFYFTVSVMTTIGFGDFTPQTDMGKIFVMFYGIIGVPFFVSIGGLFLETRLKKSIKQYLNKVHRELKETEAEIEEVEYDFMENLKSNLEESKKEELTKKLEENGLPKQDKTDDIETMREKRRSFRDKIFGKK